MPACRTPALAVAALAASIALAGVGCAGGDGARPGREAAAPPVRSGPPTDAAARAVERFLANVRGYVDHSAIGEIGLAGDVRFGWVLSDLMRLFHDEISVSALVESFEALTGSTLTVDDRAFPWLEVTDRLLAWNLPAPPGYRDWKRRLFALVEPGWKPFFADRDAAVDWRRVTWGGVRMDRRPLGDPSECPEGCIPALDDPAVVPAAEATWLDDDRVVFGLTVNGESRAYPKNVMEVHEMVNDELGGRRLGFPYCTLCASAQAYVTDWPDGDPLVLRTSGLLIRSNKLTFELRTMSLIDTFTGRALSGPLRRAGGRLEQVSVVTTTWGEWKRAHPETTVVARDGGVGRTYPDDPLGNRDDAGPIFAIGPVDGRLPVQEQVLGVIAPSGTPVAFPVERARAALRAGYPVELLGVRVEDDGGGLRAVLADGVETVSHQAFWFAWSQFHGGTAVWTATVER